MKIGVISDTHLRGPDERLLDIIRKHFHDAELILHAGDLVDLRVLDVFGDKEVVAGEPHPRGHPLFQPRDGLREAPCRIQHGRDPGGRRGQDRRQDHRH